MTQHFVEGSLGLAKEPFVWIGQRPTDPMVDQHCICQMIPAQVELEPAKFAAMHPV